MSDGDKDWMGHLRDARDSLLAQGVPYPDAMSRLAHWVSSARWGDHRSGYAGKSKASVKREVRTRVYERDGYRCRMCGGNRELTIHHHKPRAQGGGHELDNLVTLCLGCHRLVEKRRDLVKILRRILIARVSVQGLAGGIKPLRQNRRGRKAQIRALVDKCILERTA